jgi:hypothetical protein
MNNPTQINPNEEPSAILLYDEHEPVFPYPSLLSFKEHHTDQLEEILFDMEDGDDDNYRRGVVTAQIEEINSLSTTQEACDWYNKLDTGTLARPITREEYEKLDEEMGM